MVQRARGNKPGLWSLHRLLTHREGLAPSAPGGQGSACGRHGAGGTGRRPDGTLSVDGSSFSLTNPSESPSGNWPQQGCSLSFLHLLSDEFNVHWGETKGQWPWWTGLFVPWGWPLAPLLCLSPRLCPGREDVSADPQDRGSWAASSPTLGMTSGPGRWGWGRRGLLPIWKADGWTAGPPKCLPLKETAGQGQGCYILSAFIAETHTS